jgi:hypothetical protein
MATNQKDTIYIDIDDEITAIIDKVNASKERIVALVLPKRATVFQSIVNMKLLKRSAEDAKKQVVLITSESGLLPLAGAVGLYVANSLQSRPMLPPSPDGMTAPSDGPDEGDHIEFEPDAAANTPVGKLAGSAAFTAADDVESIELDNDDSTDDAVAGGEGAAAASKTPKPKKDSKLRIPDFDKFRLAIILGGVLLVAFFIFLYFANFVLPSATVTLSTDSSDIPTNVNVTLDPKAKELDSENNVFPAKIDTKQQSGSQQAVATGQKNKGTKATGSVNLSLKDCSASEVSIPAGTGVSSGGKTFITQDSVSLESVQVGGKCRNSDFKNISTQDVDVTAQSAGASFNIAAGSFTVAGFSNVSGTSSDAMTGGTDNIVKVVSQSDIDTVKQKLTSSDTGSVKNDLKSKLQSEGYLAVVNSLQAGDPAVTTSANVGDEADTVTVTSTTTYTMYGLKKSDLENFVTDNVKDKIDTSKQKILNLGVDAATFDINSPTGTGPLQTALSVTTSAGPEINTDALKTQIKGKKTNDVRTIAQSTPGVSNVTVKYSPFWVSHVPNKESKITVVIQKSSTSSSANGNQP